MAIVLSDSDLTKIVDQVFEKVSSLTLSIEQLDITEDLDEIKRSSTLPVLIYPEVSGSIDWYDEGDLKRIKVQTWLDMIENLEDQASGSLNIIEIIREEADDILNTSGILQSVQTLEEAKTVLSGAIFQLNGVKGLPEVSLLGGESARFDIFDEDTTDITPVSIEEIYVSGVIDEESGTTEYVSGTIDVIQTIDMTGLSGLIVYSSINKAFYMKYNDQYYAKWENGTTNYNLFYRTDFIDDVATEVLLKDKAYICDSSVYVWDKSLDGENNLVEISGSGSGGAGNGAFNVNTNSELATWYSKEKITNNPSEAHSLEAAITVINEAYVTKDLAKYSKSNFALLCGMTITYFDTNKNKYVNWTNTLTSWDADKFIDTTNWYRSDNLEQVEGVSISYSSEDPDLVKNYSGTIINISQSDINDILINNTTSNVVIEDEPSDEGKVPVNSDAVTSYINTRFGSTFNSSSIPLTLTIVSSDDNGTTISLARLNESEEGLTLIGDSITVKGGGSGSGSDDGSVSFSANLYDSETSESENLVKSKLVTEATDFKLGFYMGGLSNIIANIDNNNFTITKIALKKGTTVINAPFYDPSGNTVIFKNDGTGYITDTDVVNSGLGFSTLTELIRQGTSGNGLGISMDTAFIIPISTSIASSTSSFSITIWYTYTDTSSEEAKTVSKSVTSSAFSLKIANVSISLANPTAKMITSSGSTEIRYTLASSISTGKIKYFINTTDSSKGISTDSINNGASISIPISGLQFGINKIYAYCYAVSGGSTVYGNGIYCEVYYGGTSTDYSEVTPLVTGINYPDYEAYFNDNGVPCLYIDQYDQNTGFYVESYHPSQNSVSTNIVVYENGNSSIFENITTSILSLGASTNTSSSDIKAYYKYTSFFRTLTATGTFRNIVLSIGNVTRTIHLFVQSGDFKIDLPTDSNLVFDLRAKGKTNSDTSKNIWQSNINNRTFSTEFSNVRFTNTCGWTGDSLLLTGDAKISISGSTFSSEGGMTFAIKYQTSSTSDDNYKFLEIKSGDDVLLSITPTTIFIGDYKDETSISNASNYLKTAPDTTIDLVITTSISTTEPAITLSMMYLNGVLSNMSQTLYFAQGTSFASISEINIGSCDGKTMPLNLQLYNISMYNSFVSENMSLGIRALNETTQSAIDEIVNENKLFELKSDVSENYSAADFQETYGKPVSSDDYKQQWLGLDDERLNFLLDDDDLANIPAGLRVVIIQGPYIEQRNTITDSLGGSTQIADISTYIKCMNEGTPIDNDIVDTLNTMTNAEKSFRIAGSALWTYVKTSDNKYSTTGNYAIQRPVFSDQGTSAMTYGIKNLRIYTQKKSKIAYSQNPWPLHSASDAYAFVGTDYVEDGYANGKFETYKDENSYKESPVNSQGETKHNYYGLSSAQINADGTLGVISKDDNNNYTESGTKVRVDTDTYYYYSTVPSVKYTFEIRRSDITTYQTSDYISLEYSNNTLTTTIHCNDTDYSGNDVVINGAGVLALVNKYGFTGFNSIADFTKYSFNMFGKCLNSEDSDDISEIISKSVIYTYDTNYISQAGFTAGSSTYYSMFDANSYVIVGCVKTGNTVYLYPQYVTTGYYRWTTLSKSTDETYQYFKVNNSELLTSPNITTYDTNLSELQSGMSGDGIRRTDNDYYGDKSVFSSPKKITNMYYQEVAQGAILKPLKTCNFVPGSSAKGIITGGDYSNFSSAAGGTIQMRENSYAATNFCLKLDYAESSGTLNTGGARLANDIIKALVPTPPQVATGGTTSNLRTSIDGQTGILLSYSPTGWYGQSSKKYLFRGKVNWNDEKSQQDLFGFEGCTQYTNQGVPTKLTDYAKNRLLNYFYGNMHSGTKVWDDDTTDTKQKLIQKIITNTSDVAATQCWEFSTGANVDFYLDNNIHNMSDYFTNTQVKVVSNDSGTSNYLKTNYSWPTDGKNTTVKFDFKYKNDSGSYLSSANDCVGNFIPIWDSYDVSGVVNPLSGTIPGKLLGLKKGDTTNPIVVKQNNNGLDIDFGTVVWSVVEGEPEYGQNDVQTIRPFWSIAWESRYPDYDFGLTDWYNSASSSSQLDPTDAGNECTYFQLNPTYIETLYSWIASFKGKENNADEQRRFIELVPYFFNVKNLCTYYVLSEMMLACDQRLKNLMFAFYWSNTATQTNDNADYANTEDFAITSEETWNDTQYSTSGTYTLDTDGTIYDETGNVVPLVTDENTKYYVQDGKIYESIRTVTYSHTGSVYKNYGNMEGRRCHIIFYDCDTTYGINNEGFLTYSWNFDFLDEAIQNYGFNSVLWNMVRNCFTDYENVQYAYFDYNSQDPTKNKYYFDLRIAYDNIRNFASNNKSLSLSTTSYDSNITAGLNAASIDYTGVLDYYLADNAALFNDQIYNKDAIYKYYKCLLRYKVCQGNRIEHKKWWIDNRLKWMDAKYSTGIVNSLSANLSSCTGSLKVYLSAKTESDYSNFYWVMAGKTSAIYQYNNQEFTEHSYDLTLNTYNRSRASGWYWFESMIFTIYQSDIAAKYVGGTIDDLGSSSNTLKYLKNLKLDNFDALFRNDGEHDIYYTDTKKYLRFDYMPSIQNLYLYNEPARQTLSLSSSPNITLLDIYNSYVNTIILPSGSFIDGSNIYLTQIGNVNIYNTSKAEITDDLTKKMFFIASNASNLKFMDVNFYTGSTPLTATSSIEHNSNVSAQSIGNFTDKFGKIIENFQGLYLVGTAGDEEYNTEFLAGLYNAITGSTGKMTKSGFYLGIDNINLVGDLSELDKYLVVDSTGYPITENGHYVPLIGSMNSDGTYSSDICGIYGTLTLNVYPTDDVMAMYSYVFPNITMKLPDYSYIIIDNFNITSTNASFIQSGARVTNPSNKTGYEYSNIANQALYTPDGHLKYILNRRHKVLAKSVIKDSVTSGTSTITNWMLDICKLNDKNSTQYSNGVTANLTGPDGDVFVLEPHYWYKGVNDWETGKQYLFFSSTDDTTSLLKTSDEPTIGTRYEASISAADLQTNESNSKYIAQGYISQSACESNFSSASATNNVKVSTLITPSGSSNVFDIRLRNYFSEDQILSCSYIAIPSWIQRGYDVAVGYCSATTIKNSDTINLKAIKGNVFNNMNVATWNNYNDIGESTTYTNHGICTDNINIIKLPSDLDSSNVGNLHILINVYKPNTLLQSGASDIYANNTNQGSKEGDHSMVIDNIIIFKPLLSTFPWLDVYPWIEHKACLGGVYHSPLNLSDNDIKNMKTKGLISNAGFINGTANTLRGDISTKIISKNIFYKNNFTSAGDSDLYDNNPGYQLFDYDMQRNVKIMSLIKYGNLNDRYIYGYNNNYFKFVQGNGTHGYINLSGDTIATGGSKTAYSAGPVDELGMQDTIGYLYYEYRKNVADGNIDDNSDLTKNQVQYTVMTDGKNTESGYNMYNYQPYQPLSSINLYEPGSSLTDNRMPYDNCLGYQNLVSMIPTYLEPNTRCCGSVVAIQTDAGEYRIVNTQSPREQVVLYTTAGGLTKNRYMTPAILSLGKYCDIFNAYTICYNGDGAVESYGSYTSQGANTWSGNSSQPYVLAFDRCNQESNNLTDGFAYPWYETYNGSTILDYDWQNVGISSLCVSKLLSSTYQSSVRLAYRGEMQEVEYSVFNKLAWDPQS